MPIKKRKRRKKIDPKELEKRKHRKDIREIFKKSGFIKILSVSDKEIDFKGRKGDFDDIFVYENVIVLAEYTCREKSKNIGHHLKEKILLFDRINENPSELVEYLDERFDSFKNARGIYKSEQCNVIILYCPRYSVEQKYKDLAKNVKYFGYPILQYFLGISRKIKKSTRFELFDFFKLKYGDIGENIFASSSSSSDEYKGSVLPEAESGFRKGYKIVTFYLDPEALLKRAYVLRRDSWNDIDGMYQRMLIKAKLDKMRKYLCDEERVFVNNIIVTLPSGTKFLDKNGDTIKPNELEETKHANIQLPDGYNIIGLIDGQHRVYAYHEGDDAFEDRITELRKQQNLLVTGIRYPKHLTKAERAKFEAKLFLEINANQTGASSELKQAIELILSPFSATAIGKKVISNLSANGALSTQLEEHFYDKGKIKTSSIVSYGLKPILKLSGNDSLFKLWQDRAKLRLLDKKDVNVLDKYVVFCTSELNLFLNAFKNNVPEQRWTTDRNVSKVLTTTSINGLINCLRLLIENGKTGGFEYYNKKFKNIKSFKFEEYKSSHWRTLGEDLYNQYFA